MDSSQNQPSQRPRRIRSIPPPDAVEVATLAQSQVFSEEVPRFRDQVAPLAVLAAEIRRARHAEDEEQVAQLSGRLARQLIRRRIEVRDAIALAERSLLRKPDPELAHELSALWVSVGDFARGAAFLTAIVDDVAVEEKVELLCSVALLNAQGGKVPPALQALHRAMAAVPADARPHELLGALGFWADVPRSEAAAGYMQAADLHRIQGEGARAFQCLLRAFEVDPAFRPAAEALSAALRARGRTGAAEEITREHLRHGSSAARAAHHQRRFYSLSVDDPAPALEAALEAELELELDPQGLEAAVADRGGEAPSFEAFLLRLASREVLGEPASYQRLLESLLSVHVSDWGRAEVSRLTRRLAERLGREEPLLVETPQGDLRELRQRLGQQVETQQELLLRLEVARLEVQRGEFREAFEALEPVLSPERQRDFPLELDVAVLGVVVSGRARQHVARARALVALANRLPDPGAAVIYSVASEILLQEDLIAEAKDAALRAVHSDPGSARALAAQALVALSHPEHASDGQLETSLTALVARGAACKMLARSAAAQGSPQLALTWSHRFALLRPADPIAAKELLGHATAAQDAPKLVKELEFMTRQGLPLAELSDALAGALTALGTLSPEHALTGARLLLQVGSLRDGAVRAALEELARGLPAPALAAELCECLLVTAPASARPDLLLELAELRARADDPIAAARAFRRALATGAGEEACRAGLTALGEQLPPDGELARMEALVELSADGGALGEQTAALWRLGVARWDMAQDSAGAIGAWMRAAELDSEWGAERIAHYLGSVAGAEVAPIQLELAAQATDDPKRQGKLLGLAARAMLDNRMPGEALRLVQAALERAPLLTDLLTVAERAAGDEQVDQLERLYASVAAAALGTFGERAVHYRAARILERRGRKEAALRHAALAFEAVPSEGVAYVLMARLADSAGDSSLALEALQRVADRASLEEERSRWLEKAASLASLSTGGARQRVEILLRAAQVRPEAGTVESLEKAVLELDLVDAVAGADVRSRFVTLTRDAITHAMGAHGASLCLAFARTALQLSASGALPMSCLIRAVGCDLEVPEYSSLAGSALQLASERQQLDALFHAVNQATTERAALLGRPLAQLLAAICEAADLPERRAEFLCRAACDAPEDSELVELARRAADIAQRDDLLQTIAELLPPDKQVEVALSRMAGLSEEEAVSSLLKLDLLVAGEGLRRQVLLELGTRFERLERFKDAAAAYREVLDIDQTSPLALSGLERAAGRLEDFDELAAVLKLRAEVSEDPGVVRELALRRARLLDQELGRPAEARSLLEQVLGEDEDVEALSLLAFSYEKSGDDEKAAELWLRSQAVAKDSEQQGLFARKAARALFRAGEERKALSLFDQLEGLPKEERELQLELARRSGEQDHELRSLIALAAVEEPAEAALLHLDAARLALALGKKEDAERLAELAGRTGPEGPAARILACQLRLQRRPLARREDAQEILQALAGTEEVAGATQREIRAYILAEATDLVLGPTEAVALLEESIERQGQRPLLCAGLARLVSEDGERALSLYESAIGGEFHGLRDESDVLLGAAMAARTCGKLSRARAFASAVSDGDRCHTDAVKLLEEIVSEEAQRARDEKARRDAEERARKEAEEKARLEAEERARKEAEEKARLEAEERARKEAEEKARLEAEERARKEAEEKARLEAEERARKEAEEKARLEAEERARKEAEEKARLEAEERARKEAEEKARLEAEERARKEAEEKARKEAEEKARLEAEERARKEAEEKARLEAEERARKEAEEKARLEAEERARKEAEEKARLEAEERARKEAEEKARLEAEERARKEAEEKARLAPAASESSVEGEVLAAAAHDRGARPSREEVLRLAREEAARERAAVVRSTRRRSSVPPEAARPKSRSSRPPLRLSTAEDAPVVELSDGTEEVLATELREVSELSPEEEARAVVPNSLVEVVRDRSARPEDELVRALERGDVGAGLELLDRLAADRSRSHDAVIVAGHLAALRPGEGAMLGRLVAQASRDGNEALALAVRHVLGSFGAGDQVAAPELFRIEEQPAAVRSVLWRGLKAPVVEALHAVWENASAFFKREPASYGIVGTDRVSPSSPTVLAELYRDSSRVLGMGRTPLFRVGAGHDIAMRVALLSPPAVLVSGDVETVTPELSFHFGAALAACTPETALIFGTDPDELDELLQALSVSFGGAATAGSSGLGGVTKLATLLWEAVPGRAQRRLSQLCGDPRQLNRQVASDFATFALRRAGLIVCGDIRTAIADACQHDGLSLPRNLSDLARATEKSPAVADLLLLAISPEYAELRFRTVR